MSSPDPEALLALGRRLQPLRDEGMWHGNSVRSIQAA
jgi:hypothetical protein